MPNNFASPSFIWDYVFCYILRLSWNEQLLGSGKLKHLLNAFICKTHCAKHWVLKMCDMLCLNDAYSLNVLLIIEIERVILGEIRRLKTIQLVFMSGK